LGQASTTRSSQGRGRNKALGENLCSASSGGIGGAPTSSSVGGGEALAEDLASCEESFASASFPQQHRSGSAVLVGCSGTGGVGSDRGGAGSIVSNVSSSSGGACCSGSVCLGTVSAATGVASVVAAPGVVTSVPAGIPVGTRVWPGSSQGQVQIFSPQQQVVQEPVQYLQQHSTMSPQHGPTTRSNSPASGSLLPPAAAQPAGPDTNAVGVVFAPSDMDWEQEEISELLSALSNGATNGSLSGRQRGSFGKRKNAGGNPAGLSPDLIEKFQRILMDRRQHQERLHAAEAKVSQLERRNADLAVENCRLRSKAMTNTIKLQPASVAVTPRTLNDSGNLSIATASEGTGGGWSLRLPPRTATPFATAPTAHAAVATAAAPQLPRGGNSAVVAAATTRSISCSTAAVPCGMGGVSRLSSAALTGTASVQCAAPACTTPVATAAPLPGGAAPMPSATATTLAAAAVARARSESPGARVAWGATVLAGLGQAASHHVLSVAPTTQTPCSPPPTNFVASPIATCRVVPMRHMTPTPDREATYASSASAPPGSAMWPSHGAAAASAAAAIASPVVVGIRQMAAQTAPAAVAAQPVAAAMAATGTAISQSPPPAQGVVRQVWGMPLAMHN